MRHALARCFRACYPIVGLPITCSAYAKVSVLPSAAARYVVNTAFKTASDSLVVRRYHEHYHTSGHVWQGRFKAFPIQADEHLLTVLRYVERNPFRAGLVAGVADWPWSSLPLQAADIRPAWYDSGPVRRGRAWAAYVAKPQTDAELVALRRSVERGVPYGGERWQQKTVATLGLESTLRGRGRPRQAGNEA